MTDFSIDGKKNLKKFVIIYIKLKTKWYKKYKQYHYFMQHSIEILLKI